MRQCVRFLILTLTFLVTAGLVGIISPSKTYSQGYSEGGVCPPVTKTRKGTHLTLHSSSAGFTFVRFVRYDNVAINGITNSTQNDYAWPIEGLPTVVTFSVSLQNPAAVGRLYFAIWRAGCSDPDLVWEDLAPTTWTSFLARHQDVTAPVQLPSVPTCRNAVIRQTSSREVNDSHDILLSSTTAGNSIISIHGTIVLGGTVTIGGKTYESAPFTHQLEAASPNLSIRVKSPPGLLPYVNFTVETHCGKWLGGVEYVD